MVLNTFLERTWKWISAVLWMNGKNNKCTEYDSEFEEKKRFGSKKSTHTMVLYNAARMTFTIHAMVDEIVIVQQYSTTTQMTWKCTDQTWGMKNSISTCFAIHASDTSATSLTYRTTLQMIVLATIHFVFVDEDIWVWELLMTGRAANTVGMVESRESAIWAAHRRTKHYLVTAGA